MKNLRCYAKISIKNLLHNFDCVKSLLPDDCDIIPIIKANAYSHGAIEFAHTLCSKVKTFAVAEINEALALRNNGVSNSILILGYTDPSFASIMAEERLIQSVMSLEYAKKLSDNLDDKALDIHIKLDTGMHRFGLDSEKDETLNDIVEISKLKSLRVKGIFSHFAESDNSDSDFTDLQLDRFIKLCNALAEKGIRPETAHIANSAAILTRADAYMNSVRPGIILYGAYPSKEIKEKYLSQHPDKPLLEVMTLCARVAQILDVKKGETTGYSRAHTFTRDSKIAVVSAGYADGIPRSLSDKGRVKINGEAFNIVGNVCMDLLMIDITDATKKISQGDEVVFWGESGFPIDEYSELSGRISYELYTGISPRVARRYE